MMQKNNDLRILPMEERHIAQIAALERECFSSPWSEAMIREEKESECARYLIAEQDGAVCGYVGIHVILDEGYITNIAVAPACRRQGIAKRLLSALLDEMQRLAFLTLEVRAGNAPAIALYEQFGFQNVGVRKNYYTKPCEDACLMTKWLRNGDRNDEDTCDRKLL